MQKSERRKDKEDGKWRERGKEDPEDQLARVSDPFCSRL
jgi:hypothetical protein